MKRGAEVLSQVCVGRVMVLRLLPLSRLALREASGGQVICIRAMLKLDSMKSRGFLPLHLWGLCTPRWSLGPVDWQVPIHSREPRSAFLDMAKFTWFTWAWLLWGQSICLALWETCSCRLGGLSRQTTSGYRSQSSPQEGRTSDPGLRGYWNFIVDLPSPLLTGVFSWTVTMAVFPGTLTGHLPVFSVLQGYSVSIVGPLWS